jgi:acyl-coenzyme A synthetase/AMP-(fatty) acid ligase
VTAGEAAWAGRTASIPTEALAAAAPPLLGARSPQAIVAYRGGVGIEAGEFLADVADLAARLPNCRHVLNVCADRYRFAVGFAACLTSGRVSLLPSTYTPDVVRRLGEFAPDAFCLTDSADCDIEMPRIVYPRERRIRRVPWRVPQIDADQLAAIVFTSGSTGMPLPHRKTWSRLAHCVLAGAEQLGLGAERPQTIVGTVPAQHMYGFESTLLVALLGGHAFSAERPFYPADILACLEFCPRPRVLVSTPVHLRALLAASGSLPAVDLIVSATAPLARDLAREVERRFACGLVEIYGSTETGQIATRRTAGTSAWRLWPGVRLSQSGDTTFAEGGHVEQRTALCDVIEVLDEREFLLLGRTADLVNVAGKRSSFAYLDHQLNSIPGVLDGAFFLRDEASAGEVGVTRLGAAVVAPGWEGAALTARLRECIDAAFLPRPLLLVERLPRNATGKLPRQALQALVAEHLQSGGRA